MLSAEEIGKLKKSALNARRNIVKMVHAAKSGHPGGSLSGVDILTVLYQKCLNIPEEWDSSEDFDKRDRFILSKGHASPLLYSILAEKGLVNSDELLTFRKLGSKLQGHPSRGYIKGVEASTGSLGQGLSLGCGIAMGLKLDDNNANVVVYLGDGELQEGSCWEAFMQAAHRKLSNLMLKNGLCLLFLQPFLQIMHHCSYALISSLQSLQIINLFAHKVVRSIPCFVYLLL